MAHFFQDSRLLAAPTGALGLAIPTTQGVEPTVSIAAPRASLLCGTPPMLPRVSLHLTFKPNFLILLQLPLVSPIVPPTVNPSAVCESAARLLFMNVKWAKNIPSFTALPLSDQLLLLKETWRELFILGAAQFLSPLELASLVSASRLVECEQEKAVKFLNEVKEFQATLTKISQYHIDAHEFACLRAMVLFKTSFNKDSSEETLTEAATVAAIQDHTQLTLSKYIVAAHPGQPLRFGKLLLLLPILRGVSGETIEELFFRKTIGNIPIVRIICDMYKSTSPDVL